MICHHYKCIYVHIPKTAGQSIEHVFLNLLGLSWDTRSPLLLRPNKNKKLGPPRLAHLKANEYLKYKYISKDLFDAYFKFAFVRNPWSRVVSFYNYRKYYRFFSFNRFVTQHIKKIKDKDSWFFGPQYEYIQDKNGQQLVDFIGKFENLQNDFDLICERLNLGTIVLPHINKPKNMYNIFRLFPNDNGRKRHYSEYYNAETKDIVGEVYRVDIEKFDYSFEVIN
jgi:hypothetical protein